MRKTIKTVSIEIKETQKELNNKLEIEEREDINATLRKNEFIKKEFISYKSKMTTTEKK